MSDQPSFPLPATAQADETTGRYVVTFRDEGLTEGLAALKKVAGVTRLPSAAEFAESALDLTQLEATGGAVFPTLGVGVVTLEADALNNVMGVMGEDAAILDVEPERIFYAVASDGTLPLTYLQGYRDAVNHLYDKSAAGAVAEEVEVAVTYVDDAHSTWGLKATRVVNSRQTGHGIKVAVLDTGLDLQHPDFRGRAITSKSFVPGQPVQDGHGHGTHCIGTSCGSKDIHGRRYGIAYQAAIFVGKVLSNAGSGPTSGVLAGMEWAVTNGCQLISMSLSAQINAVSTAYETAGRRALAAGCLIVAAAGNNARRSAGNFGFVGQPANSPSIMAVGAVDNHLRIADFSARSGTFPGSAVDVAGPGVAVYSSVKMPQRYALFSGTSMATPHVAGIGALYAQAFRARGAQLWHLLVARALRLPIDSRDVGAGLVQAPH
jgi:subtilisin family serine protease